MNKEDVIQVLAEKLNGSKADAEKALSGLLETIQEGLLRDGTVRITGFGTFSVRTRGPRTGRNPRTGETIQMAASKSVGFKAGKGLKDAIQ